MSTSTDLTGHSLSLSFEPVFRPRNGSWCLVALKDPADLAQFARAGAHFSRDGKLVCIFQQERPAHVLGATTGPGGEVTPIVQEAAPAHFVPVRPDGRTITVFDDADKLRDVILHRDNPAIASVEPLKDLADFPPQRQRDPDWRP